MSLNSSVVRPLSQTPEDLAAVRQIDDLANGIFHGPMLHGAYPENLLADTSSITDWSFVLDGDLALINQPLDALGLNYYTPALVSAAEDEPSGPRADGHGASDFSPWPGADDVVFHQSPGERTEMGWSIDPTGLHDLIMRYTRRPRVCRSTSPRTAPPTTTSPSPTAASTTRSGSPTCTAICGRSGARSPRARTSAATTCGP